MPFIHHFFSGEDGAEHLFLMHWRIPTYVMSACVRLCVCADNYALNNIIKCLFFALLSPAAPRLHDGSFSGDVVFHAYQFPAHKLKEPPQNQRETGIFS